MFIFLRAQQEQEQRKIFLLWSVLNVTACLYVWIHVIYSLWYFCLCVSFVFLLCSVWIFEHKPTENQQISTWKKERKTFSSFQRSLMITSGQIRSDQNLQWFTCSGLYFWTYTSVNHSIFCLHEPADVWTLVCFKLTPDWNITLYILHVETNTCWISSSNILKDSRVFRPNKSLQANKQEINDSASCRHGDNDSPDMMPFLVVSVDVVGNTHDVNVINVSNIPVCICDLTAAAACGGRSSCVILWPCEGPRPAGWEPLLNIIIHVGKYSKYLEEKRKHVQIGIIYIYFYFFSPCLFHFHFFHICIFLSFSWFSFFFISILFFRFCSKFLCLF